MQLGLIVGIIFAIVAALFAMQNVSPVTVTVGFWSLEGSLALVLLVTLGLGALIAGLVSSPAMIRRQWNVTRLGRQVAELEGKLADAERRYEEMRAELSRVRESASTATLLAEEPPAEEKPYVGLRALMSGDDGKTTP
ncbi:MAG: LapA family protein [Rhodocyclaceae bacterium]|nr:LapA family protein [Rhodocyclaceae bacterium]